MRASIRAIGAGASLVLALAACSGSASEGAGVTSTQARVRGTLVIHGTGDVSLDPSHVPSFRSQGYASAWSGIGDLFRDDDLTVINLECPATDVVDPVPKAVSFRCDPAALPAAAEAGVDVVSQGNNHAFDQGPDGLLDSLERIRGAGLAPVGAGADRREALRAATVLVDGWTVAVVGIDQVVDPAGQVAGPGTPGTAAGHRFAEVLGAVRRAAAVSDLVVVAIHWGVDFSARPTALQVAEAHRMIDAGADVIFGAHSHRVQRMERYRGRPIFFGLGNFVWPDLSPADAASAVAEVTVGPDGTIRGRLLPARIVADGHPVLTSG